MIKDDAEFEELLTKALYRATALDMEETPSDAELEHLVQPSLKFQRKMRALLRNPTAYARNKRRPIYVKAMRVAASFMITLTVLFTITMAASPTVRATVSNFVRTWYDDRTEYYVPNRDLHTEWTLGYIPEGFELVEEYDHMLQNILVYENNDSEYIYINISTGNALIDNEHYDYYSMQTNGNITDVYISNDVEYPNMIVLIHEQTGMRIILISEIDISELIKVAESIS